MLGTTYMSTFLREEGRLAAITGDTAGAVRGLRHYRAPGWQRLVAPASWSGHRTGRNSRS